MGESQVPNGVDIKVLLSYGIWAAAPCHCKNRLRNIPSLADSKGTGGLERECEKLSMANSCKAQGIIMRKEERVPQEGVWDLNASPTPFRWQCEQAHSSQPSVFSAPGGPGSHQIHRSHKAPSLCCRAQAEGKFLASWSTYWLGNRRRVLRLPVPEEWGKQNKALS